MNTDEIIKQKLRTYPTALFENYLESLSKALPGTYSYIVGYGSCLSQTTQSATSVPDFYVVVHDYKTFYQSWKATQFNQHLPPNIYHFHEGEDILKYCVISRKDLLQQVQANAPDVYHIGRFSKRIALIAQTDEDALEHLYLVHTTAIQTAFTLSRKLHGTSANLDDAIEQALALSYVGDVRIEADDKVKKIYAAEKQYYQDVYTPLFNAFADQEPQRGKDEKLSFWIRKSRIRARMRWVKNVMTASSWIDYMIFKIERTKGIKLDLSDKQKKYWFIYIWPILWRFKRDKIIK